MVKKVKNNIENNSFVEINKLEHGTYKPEHIENMLKGKLAEMQAEYNNISQFNTEDKESRIHANKADNAVRSYNNELEAFSSNPLLYTRLTEIKDAANGEFYEAKKNNENNNIEEVEKQKYESAILKDDKNNLFLEVKSLHPSEFSFQIHDGKIVFPTSGMDAAKFKEAIEFLERRGLASSVDIESFKLENADEQCSEMFVEAQNQVIEDCDSEHTKFSAELEAGNDETAINEVEKDVLAIDEEVAEDSNTQSNANYESSNTKLDSSSRKQYKDAYESVTAWMNLNKRRNLSYFETKEGGYTVWTVFPSENSENMEHDNLIDKKGDLKARNEMKIYMRRKDDGKLEIAFSTPNKKAITDFQAECITDAFKDAGIKRVRIGKMPPPSEAAFRTAAGKSLIVLVGMKMTKDRFDKMMAAAEGKHGKDNPNVMKYKRDLALEMATYLKTKGKDFTKEDMRNDEDCRCVRHALGAYSFTPFRNLWEDFRLRNELENVIRENTVGGSREENGAASTIGAVMAVSKLYDTFKEGVDNDKYGKLIVADLLSSKCTTITPAEKKLFAADLQPLLEKYPNIMDTDVRDMPPDAFKKLFHIMRKTQEDIAKTNVEKRFDYTCMKSSKTNLDYAKNENEAINYYLENAKNELSRVNEELKDCGITPMFLPSLGRPQHKFDDQIKVIKDKRKKEFDFDDDGDQRKGNYQKNYSKKGNTR